MRKTAIDKAIDALEAEKKVIELAIAKLRAVSYHPIISGSELPAKKVAPRIRRVPTVAEGAK